MEWYHEELSTTSQWSKKKIKTKKRGCFWWYSSMILRRIRSRHTPHGFEEEEPDNAKRDQW